MNQKQRREDRANPDFFYIPIAKKRLQWACKRASESRIWKEGEVQVSITLLITPVIESK